MNNAQLRLKKSLQTFQDDETLNGLSLKALKKQANQIRRARKRKHHLKIV